MFETIDEDLIIIGYCSNCGAPVTKEEAFGVDYEGGWKKGKGLYVKECVYCKGEPQNEPQPTD
jgi:hypothetical protein